MIIRPDGSPTPVGGADAIDAPFAESGSTAEGGGAAVDVPTDALDAFGGAVPQEGGASAQPQGAVATPLSMEQDADRLPVALYVLITIAALFGVFGIPGLALYLQRRNVP